MFNTNQDGFVKRKEMTLNTKSDIFGLNPTIQVDGNPCYDVLYGEKSLYHIEKNISCEHSFQIEYLKKTNNVNFKNFQRYFRFMPGQLQITNYRAVFIPNFGDFQL